MKKYLIGICLILLVIIGGYFFKEKLGYSQMSQGVLVLDAVTATTTSSAVNITGASRVTLFLDQDLVGSASDMATTTYTVTVSTDNSTYIAYNKLIDNVTNTNVQGVTRVASKVVSDGTDYILSMDLENDNFSSFKVTATTLIEAIPLASTTVSVHALIDY